MTLFDLMAADGCIDPMDCALGTPCDLCRAASKPKKRTPTEPNPGTQKARILEAFRDSFDYSVCSDLLNQICFRYGARLHELRTVHGFEIETGKTQPNGTVWYTLTSGYRATA